MTQINIETLNPEQYFEFVRLLQSHGKAIAINYASLVTSPNYRTLSHQKSPRMGRGGKV